VLAGHVPLMFSDVVPALPQIREGKVRVLGVSTSVRLPSAPDIPTLAEAGVGGFDAAGWGVISVPAGTPSAVVERLRATLNGILPLPEVARQIIALGLLPAGASPPEETASLYQCRDRAPGQGHPAGGACGNGVKRTPVWHRSARPVAEPASQMQSMPRICAMLS
jgi:tripartite-type tricarboxylate transporter receptor subunit TctC